MRWNGSCRCPGGRTWTTQPIINRIEMLSTGVRNDVGVEVFGRDLKTIDRVSKEIAAALEPVKGAQGVLAWQIRGKDYLENPDRPRQGGALRHQRGRRAGNDRGRARWPCHHADSRGPQPLPGARPLCAGQPRGRVRPSNACWSAAVACQRRAPNGSGMSGPAMAEAPSKGERAAGQGGAVQVPLSAVADVRVVEGPATIRSENGQLMNYVTLTSAAAIWSASSRRRSGL